MQRELFNQSYEVQITPLDIDDFRGGNTHTHIHIKVISRNQAHTGHRPVPVSTRQRVVTLHSKSHSVIENIKISHQDLQNLIRNYLIGMLSLVRPRQVNKGKYESPYGGKIEKR